MKLLGRVFKKKSEKESLKTLKFKVKEVKEGIGCAFATVEFENGKVLQGVPVHEGEDIVKAVREYLDLLKDLKSDREKASNYVRKQVGKSFEVTVEDKGGLVEKILEDPKPREELGKTLQRYLEFRETVMEILIDLHKKEIKKHPAYKAFKKKWGEVDSKNED